MNLQKQRDELSEQFGEAKAIIASFAAQDNVAFEECSFDIGYKFSACYYEDSWLEESRRPKYVTSSAVRRADLKRIFEVFSVEMLEQSKTENELHNALVRQLIYPLLNDGEKFLQLSDSQVVKRILLQLKALGYIDSEYIENEGGQYLLWRLTIKGIRLRDEIILLKNKQK